MTDDITKWTEICEIVHDIDDEELFNIFYRSLGTKEAQDYYSGLCAVYQWQYIKDAIEDDTKLSLAKLEEAFFDLHPCINWANNSYLCEFYSSISEDWNYCLNCPMGSCGQNRPYGIIETYLYRQHNPDMDIHLKKNAMLMCDKFMSTIQEILPFDMTDDLYPILKAYKEKGSHQETT